MSQELKEKIKELKSELDKIEVEDKDRLKQLLQDLEQASNESETGKIQLIEKIKEHIDNFETEHPRATAILNDIMVTLSNIGI